HAEGAVLDRLRDELLKTEPGHHHDAGRRAELLQLQKRLDPVYARELDIEQHEIELAGAKCLYPILAAMRELDRMPAQFEHVSETFGMVDVVVDDQYALFHAAAVSSSRGRRIVKQVPFPTVLSTSIVPPCWPTICLTVASPSPVPKLLVLNRGSKMRMRFSGGMPEPVSSTLSSTASSSARVCTMIRLSRPSADASPRAWAALSIRLMTTRRMRSPSIDTDRPAAWKSSTSAIGAGTCCSLSTSLSHASKSTAARRSSRWRAYSSKS